MKKAVLLVMFCLFSAGAYCSISGPTEAAFVSDWEMPVYLGPSDSPYDPVVAMNSAGNAIVAWSDGRVMASMYLVGIGWTEPFEVSGSYPNNAFPDVAIDAGGNATVVWLAWDASPYDVLARRYVAGIGWEAPVLLCSLAYTPRVAMDDEGNIMVVYRKANGTVRNAWATRFDSTGGWESPVCIQNGTANVNGLVVDMDASGNALAVWTEIVETKYVVMASRYVPGENWSAPERIDSSPYEARWTIDIAMNSCGDAVVSWNQYKAIYGVDVWANVYIAGVGWGVAELIEHSDVIIDASCPSVSINDFGQAVVSWAGGDHGNGTVYDVYVSRFEFGVGWSSEVIVEDDELNPAYDGRAVIDDLGQIVVVWYTYVLDPYGVEIRSTRSIDGATWEDWVVVGSCSPLHGMSLFLAGDGHGSAIAVWYDYGAYAARYVRSEVIPEFGSVWLAATSTLLVSVWMISIRKKGSPG